MATNISRNSYARVGRYAVTQTGTTGLKTTISKDAVDLLDIIKGDQLTHYLMGVQNEDGKIFDVIVISKEPLPGDYIGKRRKEEESKKKAKSSF